MLLILFSAVWNIVAHVHIFKDIINDIMCRFELYLCIHILFDVFPAVQQPDPSLPRPEGMESTITQGEELCGVKNCPASLEAALQRWGAIAPKAPCLTVTHASTKQPYTLTYGMTTLNTRCLMMVHIHYVDKNIGRPDH